MKMYWGNRGTGKSLSLTNDCIENIIYTFNNIIDAYDRVDYYNKLGFNFSKKFKHLSFSNYDVNCSGTEIPFLKSYKCNPYKFGLYSDSYKTDIYPYGSTFFITEFQNYADSDMFQNMRPEVKTFYQTSRHYGLDFVVDCQRPLDVAKKIRELFDEFWECVKLEHIYKNDVCVAHKVTYRVIRNNRVLEQYLKSNDKSLCEEVTKVFPCRFSNYDSYFCEMLHLKGRTKQDYNIQEFGQGDDSDILTEVKGYYISRKDRTEKDINTGEEYL